MNENTETTTVKETLKLLADIIASGNIPKANQEWAGADVCIVRSVPTKTENGFYPEPRYVETNYPLELSWMFFKLKDAFYGGCFFVFVHIDVSCGLRLCRAWLSGDTGQPTGIPFEALDYFFFGRLRILSMRTDISQHIFATPAEFLSTSWRSCMLMPRASPAS